MHVQYDWTKGGGTPQQLGNTSTHMLTCSLAGWSFIRFRYLNKFRELRLELPKETDEAVVEAVVWFCGGLKQELRVAIQVTTTKTQPFELSRHCLRISVVTFIGVCDSRIQYLDESTSASRIGHTIVGANK
jgi:hypothetical protein